MSTPLARQSIAAGVGDALGSDDRLSAIAEANVRGDAMHGDVGRSVRGLHRVAVRAELNGVRSA
jgi:hypothetical protein